MKKLAVTLIQNSAGNDSAANLKRLARKVEKIGPTDLIALPEVFALRGSDEELRQGAEPLEGPTSQYLAEMARSHRAWVLGGSILEQDGGRVYNTTLLLDRAGNRVATYRKIHLFEVHLEDGTLIREADVYEAGQTPVTADIEGWKCGLSICYDLRFPELYRAYSTQGASLLFIPSNFTQHTGKDHWQPLVRARAIENQCFVVAPAQCGENPSNGISSYGHSMVVGPWGEVLIEAGEQEAELQAVLDPADIAATRKRIPALKHRRL